jgi:RNA polymerase sigma-70 factor (ECF subfamily)
MIDTALAPVTALDVEALYCAHVRGLHAFVYARVGNRETAEDITGDVFVKALTHLDPARTERSMVAWLYQVARSTISDYWRRGPGADTVALEDDLGIEIQPPAPPDVARQADTATRAQALLDQLPENYRRVLSYRLLDGASVAETARLMHLSESNVKVLQHRALTRAARIPLGECSNG